jgi:DNA polymerase-3 subunit gamma/tau
VLRADQASEVDEHEYAAAPSALAAETADVADDAPLSDEDEDLGPPPAPSDSMPPWEAYADDGFDGWASGQIDADVGMTGQMATSHSQGARMSQVPHAQAGHAAWGAQAGMPPAQPIQRAPTQHQPEPLQALPVRESRELRASRDAGQTAPIGASADERASPSPRAEASTVSAVPLARVLPDPAHLQHEDKPLAPLQRTELGTQWHGLVTQLVTAEAVNGFVRELALQSELVAQHGAQWQLRCASALLGNANSVDKLQAALREAGHAVQIEVTQGEVGDTPALRNQHAAAAKLNAARALLERDPFVQALQRDFAATIVPHSIRPL